MCVSESERVRTEDKAKLILADLRQTGKKLYTKRDIEGSIQRSLLVVDERTINRWFLFLWRLEYFEQTTPDYYQLVPLSVRENV